MTQNNEWIAYKIGGRDHTVLRRADEPAVKFGKQRVEPPTQQEIDAEVERRKVVEDMRQAVREFEARPEYKDAKQIAYLLEFMTHDNHNVLDKMAPAEWADLRAKLEGK